MEDKGFDCITVVLVHRNFKGSPPGPGGLAPNVSTYLKYSKVRKVPSVPSKIR